MKKVHLLCIGLLASIATRAQSDFRLGVHLDPIVTWFSPRSTNLERDGGRPGFSGGLVMEYYFRENYGFVSGLSVTQLGGNLMYNDSVRIATGDNGSVMVQPGSAVAYRASYLIVPVGLKLKTNEIGYFTYYAQLGLKQWFNMAARASSDGKELTKDDVSKEINLYGLSYFFGGGVEYNIGGATSLTAGIFFDGGFTDILSGNDHKAFINYLSLRVGIFF